MPSVLYVQYTNPAAYPPLLHSSRILADRGWDVTMLGVGSDGADSLRETPHDRIRVVRTPLAPVGWRRRVQYGRFVAGALLRIARTRPDWVYASDPFSAPVAVAARRLGLARVLYHEHDAPGAPTTAFMRAVSVARLRAARTADLLVVPNERRLAALIDESDRTGPSVCVWNGPSALDVGPPRERTEGPLTIYYHGSLNATRLPFEILDAMARTDHPFRLTVVGYETVGNTGFRSQFEAAARRLGLGGRVSFLGELAQRSAVLDACRRADIGLALMPIRSDDLNMSAMVGASNKAFDYLASGLALVVSDLSEWQQTYEAPGYAVSADPGSADSLAAALARLAENPDQTRSMGEAGRRRVAAEWTYEHQFAPVVRYLEPPAR